MKKICLLGATGQLGQEILALNNQTKKFLIFPYGSKDVDITDEKALMNLFGTNEFNMVINCAAYTAVDKAETEEEKSFLINSQAVKYIAQACSNHDLMKLIHVSTDFVFDGTVTSPLKETDPTNPIQVYGRTKLEGEQWVKETGIVVRTSWLYSSFGNNFVKTMMRLGRERDSINVINNQFGTPTYAADLAYTILKMCETENLKDVSGIYHYSNEGQASWYDFAVKIMELAEIDCQVNPIPDTEYPTPAKRPKYSVMDKSKIKKDFNLEIPQWEVSLKKCIEIIKDNESRN